MTTHQLVGVFDPLEAYQESLHWGDTRIQQHADEVRQWAVLRHGGILGGTQHPQGCFHGLHNGGLHPQLAQLCGDCGYVGQGPSSCTACASEPFTTGWAWIRVIHCWKVQHWVGCGQSTVGNHGGSGCSQSKAVWPSNRNGFGRLLGCAGSCVNARGAPRGTRGHQSFGVNCGARGTTWGGAEEGVAEGHRGVCR